MADNPLLNRVSGFAAQPVTRQLALLIGMAASVALGYGAIQWATTPQFEPIYGSMSPSDNASAITALQANGIPYQLEKGSGLLTVPYGQVAEARMALATEGFPRGGGIGFESLYEEQEMGLSSFMEQARYHRAVEAELARTIAGMDTVKGARVHLAMSKQSAFMRQGQEPSASVMVSLYPGRSLNDRQLSGIMHLVASSVPNLDTASVSVVDQAGKLLSDQGEDSDFGYTAEQFRITQQMESSLNSRILAILEPILGPDAVRAQVAAEMDFTRVETTSEQYDPETIVRSEQTTEDVSMTSAGVGAEGGIPGQLADQPPGQAQLAANQGAPVQAAAPADPVPSRESRKVTRNFEMNKSISHVRETPGTLQKLSVAVVVDYMLNEDGEKVAIDQARLDEITSLVREAVGFNQARGDSVSIINSPFIAPAALEEIPEPGILDQDWLWQAVRAGSGALALLLLFFMVVRPLIRYSTSYVPPQPQPAEAAPMLANQGQDDELPEDRLALSGPTTGSAGNGGANYHQSIALARNVANEQPARAAYVVRNWMTDDG